MTEDCDNPRCYNHDHSIPVFCSTCLNTVIREFNIDDIYEIFLEGDKNFESAIMDGEAHGIITPKGKKALIKSKRKWFSIINRIMKDKLKQER